MTLRDRWYLAAAIALPLITISTYLLWIWPRPRGVSVLAELGPYLLSLLTGLPFAWILTRGGRHRAWRLLGFFGCGFVLLWIYALSVLCGVRGVCL